MIDFLKDLKDVVKVNADISVEQFEAENKKINFNSANESAGIPRRFWNVTLDDFSWDKDLKEFATRVNSSAVCLITGSVGQGKTTACCASLHERVVNRLPVGLYFSDLLLMQKLRSLRSFASKQTEFDFFQQLGRTPFLVIDEIGTSENLDEERSFLRAVLMLRYDNLVPTMLSTNMSQLQFQMFISGYKAPAGLSDDEIKADFKARIKQDPVMDRLFSCIELMNMGAGQSNRKR